MERQLHAPVGPVSHGIVATGGQLLFVAGQVPVNKNGELVGLNNLPRQYRQVMENMKAVVEDAGGSMNHICQLTHYVTVQLREDTPEYVEIAQIRREYFDTDMPASTLVSVVDLMVPGALVEVEAIALLPT